MLNLINSYQKDGYKIEEYGIDGVITSTIKSIVPLDIIHKIEPIQTVEEEILIETRYQTMLLEMTTLGGM